MRSEFGFRKAQPPSRRQLLRAAGVGFALPVLDCFQPRVQAAQNETAPRRMVCICTPLGLHPADFFPTTPGPDYELTPHLEVFGELRKDFTVISGLSHHGQDPQKIAQLRTVEIEQMKVVHELLLKLKNTEEQGETLLDRTRVFFSSNLGDASTHSTKNLPVLLAGGGFRHGQHLAFDPDNPPPLSNLYLSMLHRLGINAEKFASSTGTLTGLES